MAPKKPEVKKAQPKIYADGNELQLVDTRRKDDHCSTMAVYKEVQRKGSPDIYREMVDGSAATDQTGIANNKLKVIARKDVKIKVIEGMKNPIPEDRDFTTREIERIADKWTDLLKKYPEIQGLDRLAMKNRYTDWADDLRMEVPPFSLVVNLIKDRGTFPNEKPTLKQREPSRGRDKGQTHNKDTRDVTRDARDVTRDARDVTRDGRDVGREREREPRERLISEEEVMKGFEMMLKDACESGLPHELPIDSQIFSSSLRQYMPTGFDPRLTPFKNFRDIVLKANKLKLVDIAEKGDKLLLTGMRWQYKVLRTKDKEAPVKERREEAPPRREHREERREIATSLPPRAEKRERREVTPPRVVEKRDRRESPRVEQRVEKRREPSLRVERVERVVEKRRAPSPLPPLRVEKRDRSVTRDERRNMPAPASPRREVKRARTRAPSRRVASAPPRRDEPRRTSAPPRREEKEARRSRSPRPREASKRRAASVSKRRAASRPREASKRRAASAPKKRARSSPRRSRQPEKRRSPSRRGSRRKSPSRRRKESRRKAASTPARKGRKKSRERDDRKDDRKKKDRSRSRRRSRTPARPPPTRRRSERRSERRKSRRRSPERRKSRRRDASRDRRRRSRRARSEPRPHRDDDKAKKTTKTWELEKGADDENAEEEKEQGAKRAQPQRAESVSQYADYGDEEEERAGEFSGEEGGDDKVRSMQEKIALELKRAKNEERKRAKA